MHLEARVVSKIFHSLNVHSSQTLNSQHCILSREVREAMTNEAVDSVKSKSHADNIAVTGVSDTEVEPTNTVAKQKTPYEKPAFRREQAFATTALSCGRRSGTGTNSKGP
jgi:hypothetical protein